MEFICSICGSDRLFKIVEEITSAELSWEDDSDFFAESNKDTTDLREMIQCLNGHELSLQDGSTVYNCADFKIWMTEQENKKD